MNENPSHARRPTRPEHSETYWQAIKYVILGLAALMILALALAMMVLLRALPWS